TTFILDQSAAGHLTPVRLPWSLGSVNWTPALIRRAVIWLSLKVGKGLLKMSDNDYREHELYELLREHGPAHHLGQRVFNEMMNTICTHPAGEGRGARDEGRGASVLASRGEGRGTEADGHGGSQSPSIISRPSPQTSHPSNTVLVFSPHPDDDVISMGGT